MPIFLVFLFLRKMHSGYPTQNDYFWLFFSRKFIDVSISKNIMCDRLLKILSCDWVIEMNVRSVRGRKDSIFRITFFPWCYRGLKKQAENRKTAEIDKRSQDLTSYGDTKKMTNLCHKLRRDGFTKKHTAKQNTLCIKTRQPNKQVDLRQYFATKWIPKP